MLALRQADVGAGHTRGPHVSGHHRSCGVGPKATRARPSPIATQRSALGTRFAPSAVVRWARRTMYPSAGVRLRFNMQTP